MIKGAAKEKVLVAWSSGKDSALVLSAVLADERLEVVSLLTTLTVEYDRVSMHGVRQELLDLQVAAARLPVCKVFIPPDCSNEQYERRMAAALEPFCRQGVSAVAFGDVFLADVRKGREEKLASAGLRGIFPIWQQDTADLARRFIGQGFKAVITCVDLHRLEAKFAGREFDGSLLAELPDGVDPCGENGEFHTFVYDGPVFRRPLGVRRGRTVIRENRFCFCDLLPEP